MRAQTVTTFRHVYENGGVYLFQSPLWGLDEFIPGEMEVIVKANGQHVEIAVWNPWRREWATIQLTGQGSTR